MKEIFEMIKRSPEAKGIIGFVVFIVLIYVVFETLAVFVNRKKARKAKLDDHWRRLTDPAISESVIDLFYVIEYIVRKDKISLMSYPSLEYPHGCRDMNALRMIALGALERQIERVSHESVIGQDTSTILRKHQLQSLIDQRAILRAMTLHSL